MGGGGEVIVLCVGVDVLGCGYWKRQRVGIGSSPGKGESRALSISTIKRNS